MVSAQPYATWQLPQYDMRQKFDRYMFDPKGNYTHRMILQRLRQRGHSRRWGFGSRDHWPQYHRPGHFDCCASTALHALKGRMGDYGIFVDLGLFYFRECDLATRIPFSDGFVQYAISQAVVDLIEPQTRPNFYAEVYRILEPGGLFVLNLASLVNGYGVNRAAERRLCKSAGLVYDDYFTSAMIFKKPRR